MDPERKRHDPCLVARSIAAMFGAADQATLGRRTPGRASQNAEQLIKSSDCVSCHVPPTVVRPGYAAIAEYAGRRVPPPGWRKASGRADGTWGDARMPAHPDLTDAQLQTLVRWVLGARNTAAAAAAPATTAKRYPYALPDGKKITLDFPLYVEGGGKKVTKDIFRGYALFNSYCFRCHGTDATESELGPNLRHSLEIGMTARQFMSVAMAGREDKGMPTWAGFLTPEEMTSIYRYVKGRSLGLLATGRPPSETD